MKKLPLFFIYLICFILQITVMHHFTFFGSTQFASCPNLILVLTIVFSFFFEDFNGVAFGVIFGILQDMCVGPAGGISALMLFAIGITLQFVRFAVYRDNKFILFFVTAVCTAVYYAGYWCIATLMLETDVSFLYAVSKIPVSVVLNYIALLVVCHFARKTKGFRV